MNPADKAALIERLARARAWRETTENQRQNYRRDAQADLLEIEATETQINRLGWLLIDTSEPAEDPA